MKIKILVLTILNLLFLSSILAQNPFADGISRRNDLLGHLQSQKDTLAPDSILQETMNQIIYEDQALLQLALENHMQLQMKDSLLGELKSENEGMSLFMRNWVKNATLLYSSVAGVLLLLFILAALLFLARRKNRLLTSDFHSQILRLEGSNKNIQEEMRKVENAFVEKSNMAKMLEKERADIRIQLGELQEEFNIKTIESETLSHGLHDKSQRILSLERNLTEYITREKSLQEALTELEKQNNQLAQHKGQLESRLGTLEQDLMDTRKELEEFQTLTLVPNEELQTKTDRIQELNENVALQQSKQEELLHLLREKENRIEDLERKASRGMLEESRKKLDHLEINLLKLEKLHRLLEIQAISQEEFDGMKKQILPELVTLPEKEIE